MLPRIKGKPSDVQGATRKQPLVALSADNTHVLRFWMEPGSKVMMEDMQGNTAMLLTKGVDVGANIVIYGVDRVLMSGRWLNNGLGTGCVDQLQCTHTSYCAALLVTHPLASHTR